jgi:hypothetical protein
MDDLLAARRDWRAISRVREIGGVPCPWRISRRFRPSMNSMTMKALPSSAIAKSWSAAMFGWRRRMATRASRRKRSPFSPVGSMWERMTLTTRTSSRRRWRTL